MDGCYYCQRQGVVHNEGCPEGTVANSPEHLFWKNGHDAGRHNRINRKPSGREHKSWLLGFYKGEYDAEVAENLPAQPVWGCCAGELTAELIRRSD